MLFGCAVTVTPAKVVFSSSRQTLVWPNSSQNFENDLNKRRELQFFLWRKTLCSARLSLRIFFFTYYSYCRSLYDATLFSKVQSNRLRGYVKNETALTCAKFGADLMNTSKVTSSKTKWFRLLDPPFRLNQAENLFFFSYFITYGYIRSFASNRKSYRLRVVRSQSSFCIKNTSVWQVLQ